MRKILRPAFLAVVSISLFFGGDVEICRADSPATYSLDQCIVRALRENLELKAFLHGIEEGDEGINEALADFLPTIGVTYGDTQTKNNRRSIDMALIKNEDYKEPETDKEKEEADKLFKLYEREATFAPNTNKGLALRLTQPLFSGFSSVLGLVKAKRTKEYRKFELHAAQQRLVADIRSNYFNKQRARILVEQLQESEKRLEQQKAIVAAWVQQKLAIPLRLVEVSVELSDVRQRIIRAISEEDIAVAKLKELMAFTDEDALVLSGNLDDPQPNICTQLEECHEAALKQRTELVLAKLAIEIARQDADAALSRGLPQANLDLAKVESKTKYNDPVELGNEFANYSNEEKDYMTVMLSISFFPFQGGKNIFTWRKQRATIEKMRQQLEKQRQSILTEVEIRLRQVKENSNALVVAKEAVAAAGDAYQMANRSAKLGMISLKELLDAELRLSEKEITLINSQHALMIAYTQLQSSVGEAKSFEQTEFSFLVPQNELILPTLDHFVREGQEGGGGENSEGAGDGSAAGSGEGSGESGGGR